MSWRQLLHALACLGVVLLAYVDAKRADDEHYCDLERAVMNAPAATTQAKGGAP